MDKREILLVSIVMGGVIPILSLILFWWIGAGLSISRVLPINESGIPVIALIGLAFGVALDALYLKRWVPRFYDLGLWLIMPLYLFCSLVMLAFFMGMPIGNLVLGSLAGVYIGRRAYYSAEGDTSFTKIAKKMSIFTALITAGESLPFALLSLTEPIIQGLIGALTGLDDQAISGWVGVTIMVVVVIGIAILQYLCTNKAAKLAYLQGKSDRS
jgi:hypothetical protein